MCETQPSRHFCNCHVEIGHRFLFPTADQDEQIGLEQVAELHTLPHRVRRKQGLQLLLIEHLADLGSLNPPSPGLLQEFRFQ